MVPVVAPGSFLERKHLAHPALLGDIHSLCASKPPGGLPGYLQFAKH